MYALVWAFVPETPAQKRRGNACRAGLRGHLLVRSPDSANAGSSFLFVFVVARGYVHGVQPCDIVLGAQIPSCPHAERVGDRHEVVL